MRYVARNKVVEEVGKADGGVTFVDRAMGHEVLKVSS
jgi:hypothetical protein